MSKTIFSSILGLSLVLSQSANCLDLPSDIGLFCKNTTNTGVAQAHFQKSEEAMAEWISSGQCPKTQEERSGLTWQKSVYVDDFTRGCVHKRNSYFTNYIFGREIKPFTKGINEFIRAENLPYSNAEHAEAVQSHLLKYLKFVKNNSELFDAHFGYYNNSYHPQYAKDLLKHAQNITSDELQQANDMKAAEKLGAGVICAQYVGIFKAMKCMDAVLSIKKIMSPIQNNSLLAIIAEIIGEPVYAEAAMNLAILIQEKIDNPALPAGHLFDDLKNIFLSLGEKEEQAIDKTFKLIAVYATNGPTTPQFISGYMSKTQVKLYMGLAAFSTGITVLNQRTFKTGQPYVFPANYQSTCDNGKPYHFWMSAFLARYAGSVVKDAKIGATAAFVSQIGYQMMSKTTGRDPLRAFATPSNSVANQKIRLDITAATLGAQFGASFVSKKPIKIVNLSQDQALKTMLISSQNLEVLTGDELANAWTTGGGLLGFQRWQKIFAPEAVYNYVFQEQ